MTTTNSPNREQWLAHCTRLLAPVFQKTGKPIPQNVRSTCGFPSRAALARKGTRIGECWDARASAGNHFEIFVSPLIAEPLEAAAILAHELVHAAVGLEAKHGAKFRKCAMGVGLEGKMKATVPGATFKHWFASVADELGPYPHQELRASSAPKKQTTRMLKVFCPECQAEEAPYIVRMSATTIAEKGTPICPVHRCEMECDQG